MADEDKQDSDQQQQQSKDDNLPSMTAQITEQLARLRQDDLELAEQLSSLYDGLCHIRQSLTNTTTNTNTPPTPIRIDSPTSTRYYTKQRADSEPNILSDRQRLLTIIDLPEARAR